MDVLVARFHKSIFVAFSYFGVYIYIVIKSISEIDFLNYIGIDI